MAFDVAGNLYAASFYNSTIEKFTTNGVASVFAADPGDHSILDGPWGLAFDSAGNLYAVNYNNSTVEKLTTNAVASLFFATNISYNEEYIAIQKTMVFALALTLQSVPDRTINPGQTLVITNVATDTNLPPPTLTFSLFSGAPTNATLGGTSGVFTWRPLISQADSTNWITVIVSDNATPSSSATNSFMVVVNPAAQPDISAVSVAGGRVSLTVNGQSGPDYKLLTATNLAGAWQPLAQSNSPAPPFTFVVTDSTNSARFYRIQLGP